ncbi:hypothetical protein BHQ15_17190 [Mycolicibacillus koreensis]|nr:hypothetical protein BHQ15_17190 [Mycolicibacillus koreensis]
MSTTPHPVDSTLHTCCNSIGQHAQDCYAATDVTGIDYGTERRVIGRWAGLAVQPLVTRRPGEAEPGIDLNEVRDGSLQGLFAGPLSPAEALELARVLVAAADEAQELAQ